MVEILQEYSTQVVDANGAHHIVRSCAEQRADGTWIGWLEFHSIDAGRPVLRTDQETSQPSRIAVEYWA